MIACILWSTSCPPSGSGHNIKPLLGSNAHDKDHVAKTFVALRKRYFHDATNSASFGPGALELASQEGLSLYPSRLIDHTVVHLISHSTTNESV